MPSPATSATSPRVLTPSQAAVVTLHAATSSPSTSSPKTRSCSGSFVPLQRFECVRVAKKLRRDGRRVYVAGVFLQRNETQRRLSECVYKVSPASKLSPEGMRAFMMAEREPDYSVEHPFSEFRELRDSIAALVKANGAHVKTCTDCQDLLHVILNPQHQHWTVKRMFGNKEQRFALLTTFVNDLLTLIRPVPVKARLAGVLHKRWLMWIRTAKYGNKGGSCCRNSLHVSTSSHWVSSKFERK